MKSSAKPKRCVVYKVTNTLNGNFYVGVTTQPLRVRLSQHFSTALTKNVQGRFQRAIRKYGKEAFIIECLAEYSNGVIALEAEIETISRLKPPYNSTTGGEGSPGRIMTKAQRAAIGKSKKGNTYCFGYKPSQATKEKLRAIGLERKDIFAKYAVLGPRAASKTVVCLDDGMEFNSASEAARHYKTARSAVIEVCNRNPKRAQAAGRVFRYKSDDFDAEVELQEAKKRTLERAAKGSKKLMIPVQCFNDGMIYPNAIEAAAAYNVHRSSIGQVCRGEKRSIKGYVFSYVLKEAA